jgi:hypothetical protein
MIRYPAQPNQRIFLVSELEGSTISRTTVRHLRDGETNPYETDVPFEQQDHIEIERLFFERTELLGELVAP